MRSKFKWIYTLLLALLMQFSFAQEKTIKGIVSNDKGAPVSGANITIKGTNRGTQSDFDGSYSIKAKSGDVLVFSFIGMDEVTRKVTSENVIDMKMRIASSQEIQEVVVTGQGIKKSKKALGFAVTTLKAEEFASKPSTDVARALTGKAPGVNIQQTSGLSGSGTNIIIRGYSSITGSNQPLFVVDGIPFNSDTNTDGNFVTGATNASSRFLDLDPNGIESISVLKGLAATTLYGSAGRSGVILVTTKGGATKDLNKKMEITFSQSLFFKKISAIADYQNNYGNGFDNNFTTAFSNWGPNFNTRGTQGVDANGNVPHPYAYYGPDIFPQFDGKTVPYTPKNNVEPFFGTGDVTTTSINVGGRSEKTSYNLGVGHTDDNGFIKNNSYKRLNLSTGGRTVLGNGFTLSSVLQYVKTDKVAPPTAAGFGSNAAAPSVFANILFTPRNIDLLNLPYQKADNSSAYYRADIPNPLWTLNNADDKESVRRFFGNFTAMYEINNWSNISYRLSLDNYTQTKRFYINKGNGQSFDNDGYLETSVRENTVFDHTFSFNFDKKLSNKFNIDGTIGFNPRQESLRYNYIFSTVQSFYGLIEHNYFENTVSASRNQNENIVGLYASTTIGFNKYLYLNFAGRRDSYSSLQPDQRSLFYPSTSLSFVPSDAFEYFKNSKINYLKLRFSYGSSAGFPDPYLSSTFLTTKANVFLSQNGNVINTINPGREADVNERILGNPALKPELVKELEFGLESKFFNNRVSVDLSLYDKRSTDLIIQRTLDPATGYDVTGDNIAEVSNRGIELALNLAIIKPKNQNGFAMNTTLNFTKNVNKVESLGGIGIKDVLIAGFTNLGNFAVAGENYGVIIGSDFQKDTNGNRLVDNAGNYVRDGDIQIIGDPNPDYRLSSLNEISFRNITFGFQLDFQKGGDIYSTTAAALLSRGLTKDTDFDRSGTVILPGVNQQGTVNTTQIGLTQYGFNNSGFFINKQAIYDATNLRLREISLSYSLPKKFLKDTPFGKLSMAIIAQNFWFKAFNFPEFLNFDPDVSSLGVGNGQGFDYLTGPSSKTIGFNFNLTF